VGLVVMVESVGVVGTTSSCNSNGGNANGGNADTQENRATA